MELTMTSTGDMHMLVTPEIVELILLRRLPDGLANYGLLADENGQLTDYMFIEVNDTEKKADEVRSYMRTSDIDLIDTFGRLFVTNETIKFEQYSEVTERWYSGADSSIKSGAFSTLLNDIIVRNPSDEEMQRQCDLLETIIEALMHPFYVIDANDYTIKMANSAAGFNLLKGNETCHVLTHGRDTPCTGEDHPCPVEKVKKTKMPTAMEHVHLDKDGNNRHVVVYGYPILDNEGNVAQVIEYNLDITDHKWTENQLETSSKRAMLYLDLLAHDVSNQLQVIMSCCELFRSKLIPEETAYLLDLMEESVHKCVKMISKIKRTQNLTQSPLFVKSLCKTVISCIKKLRAKYENITLSMEMVHFEALILADEFLAYLLTNLLENAVEHNLAAEKCVWVKLEDQCSEYKVSIADNGPGISDSAKTNLFNQIQRHGGVGLYQVKEILDKYGGRLEILDRVSGDIAQGVVFVVWLPKLIDKL